MLWKAEEAEKRRLSYKNFYDLLSEKNKIKYLTDAIENAEKLAMPYCHVPYTFTEETIDKLKSLGYRLILDEKSTIIIWGDD